MESSLSNKSSSSNLQKSDSFEEGGLTLNLKRTNSDSEEDQDIPIEDDLDLLEY
jgi:hypothetical protein